jgi:hypothetical protein
LGLGLGLRLGRGIHTYMSGGSTIIEMDGRFFFAMNQERKKALFTGRRGVVAVLFLFHTLFHFS